ncbi:MAG: phytanoyl-CoA dioxygenase family protein [Rhodospirillaceae bacterium]|nr:phytanoyl-CoA dioxygenase family protein [Rhodospirillaceae bacterium]MBT6203080.1 phytanoyl-CoA dioxygenase family protein [Rhodospirillaceae bacterium]MBT6508885.1 phytanoyl-CoA dioxygenase family protein [Rhodospirillaceae bacterium]MBT7612012.1 phytanoyl-CoA dioxygenase family protein [Rhodospirillaceae bacterium]MBT7645937.1 phytanoyl-CoA dioxygenase family protein [Rhodospirillaceae bacterium]
MALKRQPASAGKEAILEVLVEDGGLVVEGIFDPAVIEALWDELADKRAEHGPGSSVPGEDNEVFWGRNTIRFASLAQHSDAFIDIMLTPLIHEVAAAFLEESGGVDYWMNTAQFIGIGPGEPAQELHRDNDLWRRVYAWAHPKMPELSFNTLFPFTPVTDAMGATRVIPGSHSWDESQRQPDPAETVAAEMSPGDALFYSGYTFHGGGHNRTADQWRYAVQMSFNPGWLTPEEAHAFAVTRERALQLPRLAQRLLGWRSYLPGGEGGYDRLWVKDYEDILKDED